mmetsp:Transcript_25674/g.77098  ORF Transcript_25674/g.77098 Transcript_25674/m.77098 type:complete len:368 (+) Transcript_25674:234-1337(+)
MQSNTDQQPEWCLRIAALHVVHRALVYLVELGWVWPNVGFSLASTIAFVSGRFPFSAALLCFIAVIRVLRFPEGELRRLDAPPTGSLVDLPTCTTHYEWLEPPGPGAEVVVVVHGFSGDAADLRPLGVEISKAGYRVLVYDLVGRGWSGCRDARHTSNLFVSQLSELSNALALPDAFHVVGNSLGGGVAVEFARFFPRRVRSLTLVAPVGLKLASRAHVLTRVPLLPDFLFRFFLLHVCLAGLEYEWADARHPKFGKMAAAYRERCAREPAFGRSLLSTSRHFPMDRLQGAYRAAGRAGRPTLLVWGSADRTCPLASAHEILRSYAPAAELVVVRGARHCVYTEFVGDTAHAIVRFLRGTTTLPADL